LVLLLCMLPLPIRAAPGELLPDLIMAPLRDLRLDVVASGRRLLRFTSTAANIGAGPFEVHGERPNTGVAEITGVRQHVFAADGTMRTVETPAVMYFAGDGHSHWHVRDFEQFVVERLTDGTPVGDGAKHGFCFLDNATHQLGLPGAPQRARYHGCGNGGSLAVTTGISIGWADVYAWNLPDQFIDVSALEPGGYRLRAIADPDSWFLEADEQNNVTSVDFWLDGRDLRVIGSEQSAQRARQCFDVWAVPDCITGRFREYWEQQGGLAVFGYPTSPVLDEAAAPDGPTHRVQYFERARFEYHPELPPPFDVLLGRMGDDRLKQQGRTWWDFPRVESAPAGCRFFPDTGHSLCDQAPGAGFRSFWERNGLRGRELSREGGALALFGLPLSEPISETNASGEQVVVQWFERARFEWHPEHAPAFKVQLGLLGRELRSGNSH